MKTPTKERTLITGASSGIGLHLAHVFAKNGHDLVLVAPVAAEINSVVRDIESRFGVRAQALAVDLTSGDEIDSAFEEIVEDVDILCNNAGLGMRGLYHEIPLEKHLEIIRLNVEAVVRLTYLFLPRMLARGSGRILNTASIASFEPGPLMASYHASKAFVLSLTESLASENEKSGVTFTALCPGPVDTDFFIKAEMPEAVAFQKGNLMAPQDVAEAAYQALLAGDRTVIPGALNKVNVLSSHVTPKSAQAKMSQKLYADSKEHKRDRGEMEDAASTKHHH